MAEQTEEESFWEKYNPLTGSYRKKEPTSVQIARTGIELTPVGGAMAIAEEVQKDDTSWLKVAGLTAAEVAGTVLTGAGPVVRNMIRFDKKALDIAAKQNDKSREILVDMPIEDFLQAAKKEVSQTKLDNTRDLISEGKPFESIPSLSIKNNGDGTAKVTDHDGRHRAMALREQGETTIPVRLVSQAGDGPSIRWGQQNDPDSLDYVEMLPKKLIEEDGDAIVSMPEIAANIREPNQGFAQGGVVDDMNRQMEMFAVGGLSDDGMTRDPVSGNDIPPGSMAEEVRDDIPAQLSEGEYVVPADVVRFFGVKYFEDLRIEAKMGLSNMEANGRIGGEPVPSGGPMAGPTESALTPEEMAALADMGMNVGGFVPQQQPPVQAIGNTQQGMDRGYAPGGDVADFNPANYGLGFSVYGQPSSTTTAVTAPSTVALYSPDGVMRSLTLPAEQAEYDRLIAEGWSTEMTTETSVGKDNSDEDYLDGRGGGGNPIAEQSLESLKLQLKNLQEGTGVAGFITGLIDESLLGKGIKALTGKSIVADGIARLQEEIARRAGVDGGGGTDGGGDPKKPVVSTAPGPSSTYTQTSSPNAQQAADNLSTMASSASSSQDLENIQRAQSIAQTAADTGQTIAEVGRALAPSGDNTTAEQDKDKEGFDPRGNQMNGNKGGFVSKRTKKKKK